VSHVDEIEDLRHLNDHLNAEIVYKLLEWVEASGRLAEINKAHGGSTEALREELLTNVREAASKRGLDPERLERIFAAMIETQSGSEVGPR
jgi:chorismate mutase